MPGADDACISIFINCVHVCMIVLCQNTLGHKDSSGMWRQQQKNSAKCAALIQVGADIDLARSFN